MKSSGSDAGRPAPTDTAEPVTPAPRAAPRSVEVPAQPSAPAVEETTAAAPDPAGVGPGGVGVVDAGPVDAGPVDADGEADAAQPEPVEVADADAAAALSERERAILAFERKWWKHAGSKEQAIRDTFQVSSTRYYQLLNGLLDHPAALAYDPMVVGRLRRLRAARARARQGRAG
jgi:hypothetical protein